MIGRRLAVLLAGALATSPAGGPVSARDPFVLCVSNRAAEVAAPPLVGSAVAVLAAYRQLDSAQQRELREALEESVSRREARLNPFGLDLEDGGPDDRMERLMGSAPEAFGAARALLAPRYCGTDGLCVRVSAGSCGVAEHAAERDEAERARFLAWPYGYGERVRVGAADDVGRVAGELRHRRDVALVIEPGGAASSPEEHEVLALAARRQRLIRLAGEPSERTPADEGPGWVGADRELFLVPTLEAVATAVARADRR